MSTSTKSHEEEKRNTNPTQYRKKAMQDPGDIFTLPEDILKDDCLSKTEKINVLRNWEDELKHILESEAENMCPSNKDCMEEELLQNISRVIERFCEEENRENKT